MKIVYTDMVADLFHYGHVNYLKQIHDKYIKNTDNKLYVGIHHNDDVKIYKRIPILNMQERIKVISCCKYIDCIIPYAPLVVDKDYIKKHKLDIICIPNNRTEQEINSWYKYPKDNNMIQTFNYTSEISTSDIIKKIKNRTDL
jgi:cytidyltransferase-like protein|tara:strand:- start:1233 stop:1661 length:429 start_codon:yes stop_codon:yes gene_type:complete